MMDAATAQTLMALPKFGDPPAAWRQHRTHGGLATLEFGLTDPNGAALQGLHVELALNLSPRLLRTGWKMTLFKLESYTPRRAYQLDHPGRAGLKAGDHDYPHEHVAEQRIDGPPAWCTLDGAGLLHHFCARTQLVLLGPVPDIHAFKLTP